MDVNKFQLSNFVSDPCFTRQDIDNIEALVFDKSAFAAAIAFVRQLLSKANVDDDTDDVFALSRLLAELEDQSKDNAEIDCDPIEDIIADCRAIIARKPS